MAQTKRKRRSKHRGNAAGSIEARGRTSRGAKLSPAEQKKADKASAREARLNKPSGCRVESIEEPCVREKLLAQLRERRPRGVAEDQRIVVWLRVKEVAAVRPPARRIRHCVLAEIRVQA